MVLLIVFLTTPARHLTWIVGKNIDNRCIFYIPVLNNYNDDILHPVDTQKHDRMLFSNKLKVNK